MAKGLRMEDFFLGLNFTGGSASNATALFPDGTEYHKDSMFAFDEQSEKFGHKNCSYIKKGVKYMPRDTECDAEKEQVCHWNREFSPH